MRWWQVRRQDIPAGREERIDWLFDWWERIDQWVADHQPEDLPPGARPAPCLLNPAGRSGRRCGRLLRRLLGVDLDALGGSVRCGDRVRLLGRIGQCLVGGRAGRVVGLCGVHLGAFVGVGRCRCVRSRGRGRRWCRHVGALPVVGRVLAAHLLEHHRADRREPADQQQPLEPPAARLRGGSSLSGSGDLSFAIWAAVATASAALTRPLGGGFDRAVLARRGLLGRERLAVGQQRPLPAEAAASAAFSFPRSGSAVGPRGILGRACTADSEASVGSTDSANSAAWVIRDFLRRMAIPRPYPPGGSGIPLR